MNVLHQDFEETDPAGISAFLRDLPGASKLKASAPRGFRMRQALLDVFLDLPLKMKAEFVIEFRFDGFAWKKRAQAD
jgi:hypothetical protein